MNSQPFQAVIASPIGNVGIKVNQTHLIGIEFLREGYNSLQPQDPIGQEVVNQLNAYFNGKLTQFDLPILYEVTSFHQTVLRQLQAIPYGETLTYGELAQKMKTGPRAIGNACRRNPFPLVIPCHRIVAKNHLGGFGGAIAGDLMLMKGWLLQHEQKVLDQTGEI